MIHTLQHMGTLANMFVWVQKYCNQDDIVVVVDGDDSLIGSQALKVINSAYLSADYMYVYTRFFIVYYSNKELKNGRYAEATSSQKFYGKTDDYRYRNLWITSHTRTFKKKLMDAVPI